jgi:hypothetical protein
MILRLLVPVVTLAIQLVAALLAIGLPDLQAASAFFLSYPTVASSLAAAQLLVWTLICVGVVWTVVQAVREVQNSPGPLQRRFWEASVLVVGILVLLAGAVRNLTYQVPMQGGSVAEAHQALEALYPIGR